MIAGIGEISGEYVDQLREYRDLALVESHLAGVRLQKGDFSRGSVSALWQAEDGGEVYLRDHGIRHKGFNWTSLNPTMLRILESVDGTTILGDDNDEPEAELVAMTTFYMDIDQVGSIDVYHNLINTNSLMGVLKADFLRFRDRKHGLPVPTETDQATLMNEMIRGASGVYAMKHLLDAED